MLTSTYTLVALKIEQAGVRASLAAFQEHAHAHYHEGQPVQACELAYACETMRQLYRASTWRKVEVFLIPAMRKVTSRADRLLADLAALTRSASDLLDAMQERALEASNDAEAEIALAHQLHVAVDAFCAALLERLDREEKELLPLALTVIAGETWFSIANQSLIYDARIQERRQGGQRADASAMQLQLI
ncbi:MAG: hypothetical protein V4582_19505 [Pseudomonadota bacterium]